MGTMQSYPIAIVDSNELTRAGLETILRSAGFERSDIKSFRDSPSFEGCLQTQRFKTVIVAEYMVMTEQLSHSIERWCALQSDLLILVISDSLSQRSVHLLSRRGVRGFMLITDDVARQLPDALMIIRHRNYISPLLSASILARQREAARLHLTETHLDVLNLISKGHSNQEIAQTLGYARRSLYRMRKELRKALDVRSNEQLVDEARNRGLIDGL
jgi:DNA-binding NarL/FixJ family response regulator